MSLVKVNMYALRPTLHEAHCLHCDWFWKGEPDEVQAHIRDHRIEHLEGELKELKAHA